MRVIWARRWLASILALLGGFAPAPAVANGPPAAAGPLNVVFILADDLGWADLGCTGSELYETPNIDRLARQGVRFTRAYAASVCSPTRAALLTGKHPARLHMTTWRESSANPPRDRPLLPPIARSNLPHEETTLAEVFQVRGYLTALVGKWHLGDADFAPETQGFDVNIGGTHWGAPRSHFFPYRGPARRGGEFRYVPHLEGGKPGEYLTDRLTDEALRVIDLAGPRPFFLLLAHHAVHTPIEAKADEVARFAAKLRPNMKQRLPRYAAMVKGLDDGVGRILEGLEKRGLADRTIVVFSSDNGGYTNVTDDGVPVTDNSPLRSGKGSLYEGGIRVPLIVRLPGVTPPHRLCDEPVHTADFVPTLTELASPGQPDAQVKVPDGVSFARLLADPSAHLAARPLYFHYPHYYFNTTPVSAIREGRWKLLDYYETGRKELYDLDVDPGESTDLAGKHPDDARRLGDRLHAWLREVDAQLPTRRTDGG